MTELFDMIAGSETGAIIASTLVLKNDDPKTMAIQKNKFFVSEAMDYFKENVDVIYQDKRMPFFLKALVTVFAIVFITSFAFLYTEKQYNYPDFDIKIANLKQLISLRKKEVKGKEFDQAEYE